MEICFTHVLETAWISASHKKFKKISTLKCYVCVFPYFSLTMGITFPILWDFYGFLLNPKYLRNPYIIWNVCVFSYFSRTMEIHFSHVLGILWISVSPKIFEKLITLECLCFPRFFSYYGNPLSPCFGNCMHFCFTRNI